MGWSGLFEPGRSSGVIWGSKIGVETRPRGLRDPNGAQQPYLEIDAVNLGIVSDLTIFRSLAFIEISPILTFSTEVF